MSDKLADELSIVTRRYNAANVGEPGLVVKEVERGIAAMVSSKKPEDYDFVRIGEQLVASMIEAGQQQLKAAQKALEDLEGAAEEVRKIVREGNAKVVDLRNRQLGLGKALLEAIDAFHGRDAAKELAGNGEGGL